MSEGIWWDNDSSVEVEGTYVDCIAVDLSKPPTQVYLDWWMRTRPDRNFDELKWRVWLGRLDS